MGRSPGIFAHVGRPSANSGCLRSALSSEIRAVRLQTRRGDFAAFARTTLIHVAAARTMPESQIKYAHAFGPTNCQAGRHGGHLKPRREGTSSETM
jgi:hypothetical protein